MSAHLPHGEPHPRGAAVRAAARLRRLAAALAAITCTLLASAAVMPAAWAVNEIPPGGPAQAPAVGAVTAGGMPGWQITLIALGASPGRGRRGRPAGPGADRPPGSLRSHHLRRPSGHEDGGRGGGPGRGPAPRPGTYTSGTSRTWPYQITSSGWIHGSQAQRALTRRAADLAR
jgi:hypothetical protein